MKAEKWQFEYRNLDDKYEALLKEKEVRHALWVKKTVFWSYYDSNNMPKTYACVCVCVEVDI